MAEFSMASVAEAVYRCVNVPRNIASGHDACRVVCLLFRVSRN